MSGKRLFSSLIPLVALCALAGGCEMFGDKDKDDNGKSSSRARTSGMAGIPKDANIVKNGTGDLSYTADRAGSVYLYDVDSGRLIYSGHLTPGQKITINPEQDRAAIDGRVVYNQNLERKHEHRLYFDRD